MGNQELVNADQFTSLGTLVQRTSTAPRKLDHALVCSRMLLPRRNHFDKQFEVEKETYKVLRKHGQSMDLKKIENNLVKSF